MMQFVADLEKVRNFKYQVENLLLEAYKMKTQEVTVP